VLGQLPMASLASMVSKQFKNGVPTPCTAIDMSAERKFIAWNWFFLHLHCIVMGLHCLKLPQYLHILFFYWRLVFVHYCGLQSSSKDCAKSQGWWLSATAPVWDPGTLKKVLGSNPLVCRWKKPCYPLPLAWLAGCHQWLVGLSLLLCFKENKFPKHLNTSLPGW
jgi:hypothetical protein